MRIINNFNTTDRKNWRKRRLDDRIPNLRIQDFTNVLAHSLFRFDRESSRSRWQFIKRVRERPDVKYAN